MIHYVCKYAPVELFKGFGQECAVLEEMPENFDKSDKIAHANLCGFGKSVIPEHIYKHNVSSVFHFLKLFYSKYPHT